MSSTRSNQKLRAPASSRSSASLKQVKPISSAKAASTLPAVPRESCASASASRKRQREEEAECAEAEAERKASAAARISAARKKKEDAQAKAKATKAARAIPKNVIGLRRLPAILSTFECAHLIALCSPHFVRSQIFSGAISALRTSSSVQLLLQFPSDPVVRAVLERIAKRVAAGDKQVEMSVTRYKPGQFFKPHYDSSLSEARRRSSIVVFLNDVAEGGETDFPQLGIRVKPKRGDGITWNNHADEYTEYYPESEHQGLAPKSGLKYILACFVKFEPLLLTPPTQRE